MTNFDTCLTIIHSFLTFFLFASVPLYASPAEFLASDCAGLLAASEGRTLSISYIRQQIQNPSWPEGLREEIEGHLILRQRNTTYLLYQGLEVEEFLKRWSQWEIQFRKGRKVPQHVPQLNWKRIAATSIAWTGTILMGSLGFEDIYLLTGTLVSMGLTASTYSMHNKRLQTLLETEGGPPLLDNYSRNLGADILIRSKGFASSKNVEFLGPDGIIHPEFGKHRKYWKVIVEIVFGKSEWRNPILFVKIRERRALQKSYLGE